MAAGLGPDAVDSGDHQHGHVRLRGRSRLVACVLLVPGCVGDEKGSPFSGEIAIGHVDGDALFTLGLQAIDDEGEVQSVAARRGAADFLDLVVVDAATVVEQPTDQRALAVVDRPAGGETQALARKGWKRVGHQK